ncbi:efflux transporter outer membrane subunit [Cupriavidus sp. 30B13]|uniref:efflux transporter outer membrane subunit n=1 Tax=Cupriavidus sp. 30B13 TaxID=3384241 RepID=UPI003B8F0B61
MKPARMAGAMALLGSALLSACAAVGPDYVRPATEVPVAYKEQQGWKLIAPQDTHDRGPWWSVYHDPVLDGLEQQVEVSNQNLKAAEAAFRQARAAVEAARAAFFPTVSASAGATRSGMANGTSPGQQGNVAPTVQNSYNLGLGASWEPDIWGKIRRTVESSAANAQVSAADLANARLSAQAALATDYFELRVEDELKRLLDDTAAAFAKTLAITQNQYEAGFAAQADVITAQTQLQTTQAQAIGVGVTRAQLEHAIAVLTGKPPAEFSLAPAPLTMEVPAIPAGLPSTLLERNPAIAAAERAVAASNAQIGVALSAYYPDITLSASFGFAATALGSLLQASNSLWSLGPSVTQTLFDGGARRAQVDEARAAYDQSVANYRQAVLSAFQQVEDQLAALRILEQQLDAQNQAVRLAQRAVQLTINQYQAGTVPYTSVVTAQATALADEQAALTIRENRLVASVALIEALGGGWNVAQLPEVTSK